MADIRKYLDLEGTTTLVAQIQAADDVTLSSAKDYADSLSENYEAAGTVATLKTELQSSIDTVSSKVDAVAEDLETEVTRATTAEQTNATAAADAQSAADAAQADVDALETYVGTIPDGVTATTVIGYVQEKTSGIATDTALSELQTAVSNAQDAIDAIEEDYLTSEDKAELSSSIEANTDAITVLNGDSFTDGSVAKQVADAKEELTSAITTAVANAGHLSRSIVDELPEVAAADELTIYLIAKESGSGDQVYDEYMVINGAWEKIGDTAVDLTNYATVSYVDEQVSDAISTAASDATTKANAATEVANAAQSAADAAQADVDALETQVDTNTTDITTLKSDVETLQTTAYDDTEIRNLISAETTRATEAEAQALTDAKAYTDEQIGLIDLSGITTNADAIEDLTTRVGTAEENIATNTDAIDAIEEDYLTSADKTSLESAIATNADAISALENSLIAITDDEITALFA